MNRSTMILVIATLAFGSASAYLYRDLDKAHEREAVLQTRVSALETAKNSQQREPTQPVHNLPSPPDPAVTQAVTPRATNLPQPVAGPALASVATASMSVNPALVWDRSQRLLEDPDYREALRHQQRIMLPRMYPDLHNALQLDEEQERKLFDLLADQQMRTMTNARAAFALPGSTPPDETTMREWRAQQQRLQSERDAAITTLLGNAKAQQWKNYQGTLPARAQIRELRSELDAAGVPLERDQTEQLVAAIASEQQRTIEDFKSNRNMVAASTVDRSALLEQQMEHLQQQQERMHAAVAPHLSAEQLEHYERMQAAQLEMQKIQLKLMRAQADAEARGDLPSANQSIPGAFVAVP